MDGFRPRNVSSSGESLYKLLGIPRNSSPDDIKKAYRRAALKHHPDKNLEDPYAGEKFKEINHANSILSDPTKKQVYDEYGSMGLWVGERFGYEYVKSYFMFRNPCFKALFLFCGLITGCYCCCCCCLCCCCCGKLKPREEDYDFNYTHLHKDQEEGSSEDEVVTSQPEAMPMPAPGGSATETTLLATDKQKSYETDPRP